MKSKVIIFPTDTVYGIGCQIADLEGQDRIFKIKKREKSKQLAVLCSSLQQIEEVAYIDDLARNLIKKYMPGGLTIILKTKEKYISEYIKETIAVRIPNHLKALELLNDLGPMATTSVNTSGELPLNDYNEIYNLYSKEVDQIFQNFEEIKKVSSTIINLTTNQIECVREGVISFNEIKDYIKTIK